MKIKNLLAGVVAIGALALGSQAAQAVVICTGCEYDDAAAGTHLGLYNPATFDLGTFQHSDLGALGGLVAFVDFWVFDVDPAGNGTISADFTTNTSITGFMGELFADGGSVCAVGGPGPAACSAIATGAPIGSAAAGGTRTWEIIADLPVGRYVIQVSGTTNGNGVSTSAYTGQLSILNAFKVPEPGTLALLGLGLLAMGFIARRRRG